MGRSLNNFASGGYETWEDSKTTIIFSFFVIRCRVVWWVLHQECQALCLSQFRLFFSSRSDGLHMGIWSDDAISLSSFDALYNLRILRDPGQKVGWSATIIFTKVRKIFHGSSFFYAFWLYFEDIVILSCFQDMDLYLLKGLVEMKH